MLTGNNENNNFDSSMLIKNVKKQNSDVKHSKCNRKKKKFGNFVKNLLQLLHL